MSGQSTTPAAAGPMQTNANQPAQEQMFVVTPRLEQSMSADLAPLLVPLGVRADYFRKAFGGTAQG